MWSVASANGKERLSSADESGITSAGRTVFGSTTPTDVSRLSYVEPRELADIVDRPDVRLNLVRALAVIALVDGIVEQPKLSLVVAYADALGIDQPFVHGLRHLLVDDVRWTATDMQTHNIQSIPGLALVPDDPFSVLLPYRAKPDAALTRRYEELQTLPHGALGRAFFEHYKRNNFSFPGAAWAPAEAWATYHDCGHILSGYSTSAQGELLVAAFIGAMHKQPIDLMEAYVLPVILTYHMGIELNKGINKGDVERVERDPSWRNNYEGNVHLGLDPAKVWIAWDRGTHTTGDVFSGTWDFWAHVDEPVDQLREDFRIAPLAPEAAAVPDDQIDPALFARPGFTIPRISTERVVERPTGA
jgi:hypothetical protein